MAEVHPDNVCPRCRSRMVQSADEDGLCGCVICGERWPSRRWAEKIQARQRDELEEARSTPLQKGPRPTRERVLIALRRADGPLTVDELAGLTGVMAPTVRAALVELFRAGLIAVRTRGARAVWELVA